MRLWRCRCRRSCRREMRQPRGRAASGTLVQSPRALAREEAGDRCRRRAHPASERVIGSTPRRRRSGSPQGILRDEELPADADAEDSRRRAAGDARPRAYGIWHSARRRAHRCSRAYMPNPTIYRRQMPDSMDRAAAMHRLPGDESAPARRACDRATPRTCVLQMADAHHGGLADRVQPPPGYGWCRGSGPGEPRIVQSWSGSRRARYATRNRRQRPYSASVVWRLPSSDAEDVPSASRRGDFTSPRSAIWQPASSYSHRDGSRSDADDRASGHTDDHLPRPGYLRQYESLVFLRDGEAACRAGPRAAR